MKRLDSLVIRELVGPWIFGVSIFTVLVMAGSYLFKLTDYAVHGIATQTVVMLLLLYLPGVMVKTFAMASLLATLLAFGRLSGDSEVVALRAAGASLVRIVMPVACFGIVVATAAFIINEKLVPYAAYQATGLKAEIEKKLTGSGQPVFRPVYDPVDGKIQAMMMAKDFNLQDRTLVGVSILTYSKSGQPTWFMYAPGMKFQSDKKWEIMGTARVFDYVSLNKFEVQGILPNQITQPPPPEDVAASKITDLDSFSMAQTLEVIKQAKLIPTFDPAKIANYEYGYWNKLALPLAAFIFALVGAPLGIRNHRTGAAVGFAISVLIIFLYMIIINTMAIAAQGGAIAPWAASFTPIALGIVAAVVLIYRKNL